MKLSRYIKRVEAVMLAKVPREEKSGELTPWQFITSRKDRGAFELVYRVPIGKSVLDLERQIDALYAACGAVVELKDYAGAVLVRILPEDFPPKIDYNEKFLGLSKDKKEIVIGFDRQGAPIIHSLRVPHLLIAGKSGYGKTDIVRWILFQLIHKMTSDECEIWIVDLKGFSFIPFKGVPHVTRIVRDLGGASKLLADAVKTMEERSRLVWDSGDRRKAESFKTIFVLIDEAYMISPKTIRDPERKKLARDCDEAAAKISGSGREAGVGLIYCTQRPDSEVINPLVKANMDCKICFKTETASNSEIVLDQPGAEKLPQGKPGRVLYSFDGLIEAQAPYIGKDDAWDLLLAPYKKEEIVNEERNDIDLSEGHSNIFDGTGSEIFLDQWEPVQTGKRDAPEIGGREPHRGQAEGNREKQNLEVKLDWSEIFRNR